MPLRYSAVNTRRDPLILLCAPHAETACHVARDEKAQLFRVERGSCINFIILVRAAQQPLVVADRQQRRRKEHARLSFLQALRQFTRWIHTEQPDREVFPASFVDINLISFLHPLVDHQKMGQVKIRRQEVLLHLCGRFPVRCIIPLPLFTQDGSHLLQDFIRSICCRLDLFRQKDLFPASHHFQKAGSGRQSAFIFKRLFVWFKGCQKLSEFLPQSRINIPDHAAEDAHLFSGQGRAVHIPASVHQVVSLVHKEQILVSALSLREEPPQPCVRVKEIIIIPDHRVGEQGDIQPQFKGAYLILFSIREQDFPAHIFLFGQKIEQRLIDPVIVPLCPRTSLGRTEPCLHGADLVFGRELHTLEPHSLFSQDRKGLHGDLPGHCFGSEIEKPVCLPFSHSFECRKYRGDRLAGSCRRLQKQLFAVTDRVIYVDGKIPLTGPVGKRELQVPKGRVTDPPPADLQSCPAGILPHEVIEPCPDLRCRVLLGKPLDLFRRQTAICHTHPDHIEIILYGVYICIALCLCQMHRLRFRKPRNLFVCSLDLINGPGIAENRPLRVAAVKDAVRPSLQKNCGLLRRFLLRRAFRAILLLCEAFRAVFLLRRAFHALFLRQKNGIIDGQRHFRRIFRSCFPLQFPVHPGAFQHGLLRNAGRALIQIAGPQHEFHQIPDRDFNFFTHT